LIWAIWNRNSLYTPREIDWIMAGMADLQGEIDALLKEASLNRGRAYKDARILMFGLLNSLDESKAIGPIVKCIEALASALGDAELADFLKQRAVDEKSIMEFFGDESLEH